MLVIGEVILAIGQFQTALQQVCSVVLGIVEAGSHPQSKKMCGVEVGVIQRVDVSTQSFSQGGGQLLLVADGGDGLEMRFQRRQALGVDASLIHV